MTKATSASEWFSKAQKAYAEKHQACAWCGAEHQVRCARHGPKQVYSCQRCDFQVSHDSHTKRFHVVPGEEQTPVLETMHELPVRNLL